MWNFHLKSSLERLPHILDYKYRFTNNVEMVQFYIYLLVLFVNEKSEKNPVNNYTEAHMRVRF